jgi:predicted GNAT family N-acyltransferase
MPGYQDLFADAANVLPVYFENAAHNARALKENSTSFSVTDSSVLLHKFCSHRLENYSIYFVGDVDLSGIFAPISSQKLSELLNSRMGTEIKSILMGTISGEHEFTPTIMHQLFELHTAVFLLNACVATILDGKDTSTDWRTIMGVACDEVMYKATLLQSMFKHASNLAQNKHVYPFLLNLVGFSQSVRPSTEELKEALACCNQYTKEYNEQVPQAIEHLMQNAFDASGLEERIQNETILNGLPIWFMCGYNDDDKIINDVWLPQQYAAPLMQAVADEEARARGGAV